MKAHVRRSCALRARHCRSRTCSCHPRHLRRPRVCPGLHWRSRMPRLAPLRAHCSVSSLRTLRRSSPRAAQRARLSSFCANVTARARSATGLCYLHCQPAAELAACALGRACRSAADRARHTRSRAQWRRRALSGLWRRLRPSRHSLRLRKRARRLRRSATGPRRRRSAT